MKTSTALVVAGAVGAGLYFLSRDASGSETAPTATKPVTVPGSKVSGGFVQPGPVVPILAPAYAVLKPISDNFVHPLVVQINHGLGGGNPWDKPRDIHQNPDGTYTGTDGQGASITFNKDGTITRKNPPWTQTNGGKVIVGIGHAAKGIYENTLGRIF